MLRGTKEDRKEENQLSTNEPARSCNGRGGRCGGDDGKRSTQVSMGTTDGSESGLVFPRRKNEGKIDN